MRAERQESARDDRVPVHAAAAFPLGQMSVTTPEDLARQLASDGVACA